MTSWFVDGWGRDDSIPEAAFCCRFVFFPLNFSFSSSCSWSCQRLTKVHSDYPAVGEMSCFWFSPKTWGSGSVRSLLSRLRGPYVPAVNCKARDLEANLEFITLNHPCNPDITPVTQIPPQRPRSQPCKPDLSPVPQIAPQRPRAHPRAHPRAYFGLSPQRESLEER